MLIKRIREIKSFNAGEMYNRAYVRPGDQNRCSNSFGSNLGIFIIRIFHAGYLEIWVLDEDDIIIITCDASVNLVFLYSQFFNVSASCNTNSTTSPTIVSIFIMTISLFFIFQLKTSGSNLWYTHLFPIVTIQLTQIKTIILSVSFQIPVLIIC